MGSNYCTRDRGGNRNTLGDWGTNIRLTGQGGGGGGNCSRNLLRTSGEVTMGLFHKT